METVLSLIAIGLSGTSLLWQFSTWRAGGPVVVVTTEVTHPVYRPEEAIIRVTVANKGRAAVELDGTFVVFGRPGRHEGSYELPIAPEGKRRLDAHSSFDDYRIPVATLLEAADAVDYRLHGIHAAARLATGVVVLSEKPIPLSSFLQ